VIRQRITVAGLTAALTLLLAAGAQAAPGDIYTFDPVSKPGAVPRILRIDPATGAQAAVATGTFDAAGAFGLAREPGGTLVLANGIEGNLARINPATGGVTYFATDLTTPRSIAIDTNGDIYVTDQTGDFVYKVNPATGAKTTLASGGALNTVRGITIGPGGDLFLNDSAGVFRLSKAGGVPVLVKAGAPIANPQDIVAGSDGFLYVTNFGGEVIRVTTAGVAGAVASGAPLVNLNGAALDAKGNLIVSDQAAFGSGAIFRIESPVVTVGSGNLLEDPRGMVAEPLVPASPGRPRPRTRRSGGSSPPRSPKA